MTIKGIIQKLYTAITDACLQESNFESWLILNDGIIDAIDALKALDKQEPVAYIRVSKTGNVMACAKTGDFYKLPDKTFLYTSPQPAPVHEPVKISHKHEWFRTGEMKVGQIRCITCGTWGQEEIPQRKPLSDEQIEEIAEGYLVDYRIPAGCAWNFARDIEAAHGIKE